MTDLPPDAVVILVGPSGSGKSTWASGHVDATAVLSSDAFRAMVAGDAADQSASADAFKVLSIVARARVRRGLLTVIDATNLTVAARRALLRLAARSGRPAVAVVFDVTLERCLAQNAARVDRRVPDEIVRRHHSELQHAIPRLPDEGYSTILTVRDGDLSAG